MYRDHSDPIVDDARRFWADVILAYTRASNSVDSDSAIRWADKVYDAYIARFGASRR